nr:MAG TPA: hypothetical protein [Caudoviricetes sp.]
MHIDIIGLCFRGRTAFPYSAVVLKTIPTTRKRNDTKRTNWTFIFPHKENSFRFTWAR